MISSKRKVSKLPVLPLGLGFRVLLHSAQLNHDSVKVLVFRALGYWVAHEVKGSVSGGFRK